MDATAFTIVFTEGAIADLQELRTFEQRVVLDGAERLLAAAPLLATRNRKPLNPNELSTWEARLGRLRVFYDVDETEAVVVIRAVGRKVGSRLFIGGREYEL